MLPPGPSTGLRVSGPSLGMGSGSGAGMTDGERKGGVIRLWGLGFWFVCWEESDDGGLGFGFRGREASLVQPRVSVSHGRQARGSRQRASLPPVFQFSRPTRRGGWVFSRCRRWVKGNLRGERRGRFFKGHKAGGFSAGLLCEEPCRLMLWTFHRLDGQGRGTGPCGVSEASLGFWFLLEVGVGSRLRSNIAHVFG